MELGMFPTQITTGGLTIMILMMMTMVGMTQSKFHAILTLWTTTQLRLTQIQMGSATFLTRMTMGMV